MELSDQNGMADPKIRSVADPDQWQIQRWQFGATAPKRLWRPVKTAPL